MVERSTTAERLVDALERVFATAGGRRKALWRDIGPELVYEALQQFSARKDGVDLHSTRYAVG
jgi:hypothetical protein